MSLPVLLFIAVAIPLTIVAALILFNGSVAWIEARPHRRRGVITAIGLLYGAFGLWDGLTRGRSWIVMLQIAGCILMLAGAVFEKPGQETPDKRPSHP